MHPVPDRYTEPEFRKFFDGAVAVGRASRASGPDDSLRRVDLFFVIPGSRKSAPSATNGFAFARGMTVVGVSPCRKQKPRHRCRGFAFL